MSGYVCTRRASVAASVITASAASAVELVDSSACVCCCALQGLPGM
jgi:hypothetical protein